MKRDRKTEVMKEVRLIEEAETNGKRVSGWVRKRERKRERERRERERGEKGMK